MAGSEKKMLNRAREGGYFEQVDSKVKEGVAISEIARWIQEDLMEQTDIKRSSLERKLYDYKAALPPGARMDAAPERPFVHETVEKMGQDMKEIKELERLYLYQLKRISIDGETEQKINKLFRAQSGEIKLAVEILDKLVTRKMELGLLDKAPDKLDITGNVNAGFSVLDIEKSELPDKESHKLGVMAQKMLKAMVDKKDENEESEGEQDG